MKKVTAEVIEKNRYLVTVEVEDNATDGDILLLCLNVRKYWMVKKMSKEYECFGYKDMMQLMNAIKAYDYDGWQLVSVGHNGKFYFAVVQRDKIEIEESEEK